MSALRCRLHCLTAAKGIATFDIDVIDEKDRVVFRHGECHVYSGFNILIENVFINQGPRVMIAEDL